MSYFNYFIIFHRYILTFRSKDDWPTTYNINLQTRRDLARMYEIIMVFYHQHSLNFDAPDIKPTKLSKVIKTSVLVRHDF